MMHYGEYGRKVQKKQKTVLPSWFYVSVIYALSVQNCTVTTLRAYCFQEYTVRRLYIT